MYVVISPPVCLLSGSGLRNRLRQGWNHPHLWVGQTVRMSSDSSGSGSGPKLDEDELLVRALGEVGGRGRRGQRGAEAGARRARKGVFGAQVVLRGPTVRSAPAADGASGGARRAHRGCARACSRSSSCCACPRRRPRSGPGTRSAILAACWILKLLTTTGSPGSSGRESGTS